MNLASIALAALSEFPSTPVVVFDADARCVTVFGKHDPRVESIFGERAAIVGRRAEEYMGVEAAGFRLMLTTVLASGESASVRTQVALPEGEFVLESTLWPLAGMPLVACQIRNVSEVDQLRRERDASESRARAIFEYTTPFVCELSADGTILYVGSRTRELAVEPASLVGGNIRDVARLLAGLHPDDAPLVTASLQQFVDSPSDWSPYVARMLDRDGGWRTFEISGGWYPAPDEQRRGLLVVQESRPSAERAAGAPAAQRTRASLAPESAYVAFEFSSAGIIASSTELPPGWAGHTENLAGRDVFSFLHPDDRERARYSLERAAQGVGHEAGTFRWRGAESGWRWFEGRAALLGTSSGDARLIATAHGISRERALERARPEENGEALQRDNLVLLAGGVAHDFNNLLAISLGAGDLLAQQLPSDSPLRSYLEQIIAASRQAADLSRQLLAACGKAVAAPLSPVDLNEILRTQESLLRTGVPKRVHFELSLADGALWIDADATQLREVVLNLVVNAGEALGEKRGTIRVATGRRQDLDPPNKQPPSVWAVIEVSDDGPGLDEETRRQMFEPRFTTKPSGHGLGLAVVGNIVRRHAGRIQVASGAETGTTFRIEIPSLPERAVQAEREFAAKLAHPRHEDLGVLVVDDDDGVRRMCAAMLGVAKFRVFEASDAETARSLLEREPAIVCAVVDLVLSNDDGLALIDEMRKKRPDVRAVLCSGAVDRIPADRPDLAVLEKPFRYGQLIEAVWGALEADS